MVEYLLKEKEKAEKAFMHHAEQMHRADVKLEVINEMLEDIQRAEEESKPVETAEETTVETEV